MLSFIQGNLFFSFFSLSIFYLEKSEELREKKDWWPTVGAIWKGFFGDIAKSQTESHLSTPNCQPTYCAKKYRTLSHQLYHVLYVFIEHVKPDNRFRRTRNEIRWQKSQLTWRESMEFKEETTSDRFWSVSPWKTSQTYTSFPQTWELQLRNLWM